MIRRRRRHRRRRCGVSFRTQGPIAIYRKPLVSLLRTATATGAIRLTATMNTAALTTLVRVGALERSLTGAWFLETERFRSVLKRGKEG